MPFQIFPKVGTFVQNTEDLQWIGKVVEMRPLVCKISWKCSNWNYKVVGDLTMFYDNVDQMKHIKEIPEHKAFGNPIIDPTCYHINNNKGASK